MYNMKDMPVSPREVNAIRLYEGCDIPGECDEFYKKGSAYQSFNLLMMEGSEGERVRVCVENQRPCSLYILRWEKTMEVLTDIYTVQCKYARLREMEGHCPPDPLERGDRKVNFDLMCAAGGTYAFTSTSKDEVRDFFLVKKEDPHVLHIALGPGVPYLDFEEFFGIHYDFSDEREVLLPPMVGMTYGPCRVRQHEGLGPVCHYDVRFAGITEAGKPEDAQALADFLEANAEAAAGGLDNLLRRKTDAEIFQNGSHVYWKWKEAFQKLTLQRMRAIYEAYYG